MGSHRGLIETGTHFQCGFETECVNIAYIFHLIEYITFGDHGPTNFFQ